MSSLANSNDLIIFSAAPAHRRQRPISASGISADGRVPAPMEHRGSPNILPGGGGLCGTRRGGNAVRPYRSIDRQRGQGPAAEHGGVRGALPPSVESASTRPFITPRSASRCGFIARSSTEGTRRLRGDNVSNNNPGCSNKCRCLWGATVKTKSH